MKKVLLFIAILFFFDRFGQAQSLTIEYNIGHGSYQMSDMKDILKKSIFYDIKLIKNSIFVL